MKVRAIFVVLLAAVALCAFASLSSASIVWGGGSRVTSPSIHGGQVHSTGLIWGGGGAAPTGAIGQRVAVPLSVGPQTPRPSWRSFPGIGWWGFLVTFPQD